MNKNENGNTPTNNDGSSNNLPPWLPEPDKIYEGQLISAMICPRKNADGDQIIITYWLPEDQALLKTYFPLDVCKFKSGRHHWFLKLGIDPPDEEDEVELRKTLESINIQKPICRVKACLSQAGRVFGYLVGRRDLLRDGGESGSPSPVNPSGSPLAQGGAHHVQ